MGFPDRPQFKDEEIAALCFVLVLGEFVPSGEPLWTLLVGFHLLEEGGPGWMELDQAWTSFFEEMEAYQERPERFTGRPKLPKYKHKTEGRNLLVFELGAIWKAHLAQREIAVSQLGWLVETKQNPKQIQQVRLVPKADHYVVEVIYQFEVKKAKVDQHLFVALDPGVSVLAALTSSKPGFSPRLVPV